MPFFDLKGKLLGYMGVDRDITERKKAELIIKTNESRLNAIINTTMTGISIYDIDGYLLFTNPAAERIHGYNMGEIVGKHFRLSIHPDDIIVGNEIVKGFLSGKIKFPFGFADNKPDTFSNTNTFGIYFSRISI